jgi:sugar porter (SP) family MFS transporter
VPSLPPKACIARYESEIAVTRAEFNGSHWYLYRVVLVVAVGGFLFGYDLSLISGAILFVQREFSLSPFWTGVVVSSAILGCSLGSAAGAWLSDGIGRKRTLLVACALFAVSAFGCAAATRVEWLIAARIVVGLGVGLASTVSPMYIAELAPPHLRGRLVVMNQLAIVIGLSMAVWATYALSFGEHWRWMFLTQLAPAAVLTFGLLLAPESPRWLAMVRRTPEALAVLIRINGPSLAAAEIVQITNSLSEETGGLKELIRPGVRRALVLGVLVMIFQQINGVNMILLYTPTLFVKAGITAAPDAILNSLYVNVWILLCTVASFALVRRFGRRPILIVGAIVMAVGHGLMYIAFAHRVPVVFVLTAMLVPTGAFTLTLAPVGWVVLSELFPNRIRGTAMAIATAIMFAVSYALSTAFPVLIAWCERQSGSVAGAFLVFVFICLLGAVFVERMLPETKDRTLEEIGRFWLRPGQAAR